MQEVGEKCAIFGIYGKDLDVARLSFFGLYALQHRGQENSGLATTDGKKIYCHKGAGLVAQVYNEDVIKKLDCEDHESIAAIGHNRYSTSGGVGNYYAQPFVLGGNSTCRITPAEDNCLEHQVAEFLQIESNPILALVHNGNLPSTTALENFLKEKGVDTTRLAIDPCIENEKSHDHSREITPSDSSLITAALSWHLRTGMTIEEAVEKTWPLLTGSFSILVMTADKLVAIRDHCGIRPLSIARLNGGFVLASETCAFHPIGAEFLRDVNPGEMIVIDEGGLKARQIAEPNQKLDIFEFVYFSRPDSELLGQTVYEVRKRFGEQLAREYKIEADVVIPVPETSIPVAIGFSNVSGIPFEMGLVKSRYIHRTFIQPEQHIREQGVKLKLAPLTHAIKGKRVVIADDSLVRGTTSKQIVKMLFETGATEVHFIVSSPPVKFPDFYGIDLPDQNKLFAASRTVEEMRKELGATSLNFLSFDGMVKATNISPDKFCTACFTGEYPIDLKEKKSEIKYE